VQPGHSIGARTDLNASHWTLPVLL
jgi:hypothetical protein